ncbi:hypothetical protein DFQ27_001877 [Actinomortierella ambigua]|uniref:Kelch repeat protein n=1 Tax=Actinomortierella ambigua TaxID=1343610 RepID=A0A9P6U7T7_9FUNG|nr:hypothetical protein DFQ26_009907 [Actinomortierella ambigua]KAG0263191.1 hypothetical protein DFQ27_001877 [Actinomortierella ambigua]
MQGRYVLSFVFSLVLALVTSAQQIPVAPLPASGAAYAKYKDKLYIYGGMVNWTGNDLEGMSGQFFALDLSKAWRSETPAWIRLPDGPQTEFVGAAISLDGKAFMTSPGADNLSHRFFFENNTWSLSNAPFRESMYDVSPVTLGTDGTVLIVGGSFWNNGSMMYDIYSFDTDQVVTALLPSTISDVPNLPGRRAYKAVWSEYLKSAVFYGGFVREGSHADTVSLYHPESNQWKAMITSGFSNNKALTEHCIAIADDGKRLFVYGGWYGMETVMTLSSDLFILDLVTGVWTKGLFNDSIRGSGACTVAGDYFLLWGDVGNASTPVYIYQISKNAWVEEFDPFAKQDDPDSALPSADSKSKPNIGAILGGVAGAIGVVGVVGFLAWKHRRDATRHHGQQDILFSDPEEAVEGKPYTGSGLSSENECKETSSDEKYDPQENSSNESIDVKADKESA